MRLCVFFKIRDNYAKITNNVNDEMIDDKKMHRLGEIYKIDRAAPSRDNVSE